MTQVFQSLRDFTSHRSPSDLASGAQVDRRRDLVRALEELAGERTTGIPGWKGGQGYDGSRRGWGTEGK